MGIRIHKQLGYGLTDVQHEDYKITDPRINTNSILLKYGKAKLEDYVAWLQGLPQDNENVSLEKGWISSDIANHERLIKAVKAEFEVEGNLPWKLGSLGIRSPKRRFDLDKVVSWGSEYQDGNILCVTPLWLVDNWRRYDDTMDWIEETYLGHHESQSNYVEVLDNGIFPYSETWMDTRTGQRIQGNQVTWWRRMYNLAQEQPDGKYDQVDLDTYAQAAGFDDHQDALVHCAPLVPSELRHLVTWGELFTSDDVISQLRPMLNVYWS